DEEKNDVAITANQFLPNLHKEAVVLLWCEPANMADHVRSHWYVELTSNFFAIHDCFGCRQVDAVIQGLPARILSPIGTKQRRSCLSAARESPRRISLDPPLSQCQIAAPWQPGSNMRRAKVVMAMRNAHRHTR